MKHFYILFLICFLSCSKKESYDASVPLFDSTYDSLPLARKKPYLDSIGPIIHSIANDSLKTKALFDLAAAYYYLNENSLSYTTSKAIFDFSKKHHDSVSMGRALYYMGDCFENYQKDSAYYYYKQSEKMFRALRLNEKIGKALFNKAYLLFTEGNYVESEVEVMKALQEVKGYTDYEFLYSCYSLQAANHTELEEYDDALTYMQLAQEHLEKMDLKQTAKAIYTEYALLNQIAFCNIYDKKGAYARSIAILTPLATASLKTAHPKIYATVLGNLAYDYMKIGNYALAKEKYDQALTLCKVDSASPGYLYKIINYGEYHLLTKDTATAVGYFKKALPLSKQLQSSKEILKTLQFLSLSDQKNAASYNAAYVKVSDSLIKQQRFNRDKFARIEYETGKVVAANKILSNYNLRLILVLTLSIVVFLFILLIKSRRARRKELQLIQQKELANDELLRLIKEFQFGLVQAKEEEQNRISKELHDGIVNQIYAIRMVLDTLNDEDDASTKAKRVAYIKELHAVESEIRSISHALRTDFSIFDSNYLFLIHSLLKSNNALGGTVFSISVSDGIDWDNYSSILKINLYRILQELFLNVHKYAKASVCSVSLEVSGSFLEVTVRDNGVGFDKNSIHEGIGLKNIQERAQSIGATIEMSSKPNEGSVFWMKVKGDG